MGELERLLKKLERMEAMLLDIEARLDIIERSLGISSDPVLRRALELSKVELSLATNLIKNYEVLSKLPSYLSDDITIATLISLINGPKSISRISEDVRRMRGKGSRRIVSDRLKSLENLGIVKHKKVGKKKVYFISLPSFAQGSSSSGRSSSGPS